MKLSLFMIFVLIAGCKSSATRQVDDASTVINVDSEVNKILNLHNNKVLTPNTVSEIPKNWSDIEPGFNVFYTQKNVYTGKVIRSYGLKLTNIDNNKYYFSEYNDGKLYLDYKSMYDSGVHHRSYKEGTYSNYQEHGNCKYTLGKCVYTVAGKTMRTYTEFKDGVWYRNITGFGPDKQTKEIYDKYGLLLFKHVYGKNSVFSINFIAHRTAM